MPGVPAEDDLIPRILKIQSWCRKHSVPYIHGCMWDRECREYCPERISFFLARWMFIVDFPYYGPSLLEKRRQWHRPGFIVHTMSKQDRKED